jgi:hypothetical protein
MYRTLNSEKIVETLERLRRRIAERFPNSGLSKVCAELAEVARENDKRTYMLQRPNYTLRVLSAIIVVLGVALAAWVTSMIEVKRDPENVYGVLQGIDALMNIIVLIGATVLFLLTLEGRWKRQQAMADLDELRSIVHVIDMHQLTKDPMAGGGTQSATESSPTRVLTPFELTRYLDYCSEMLSLTAKVAALYAQSSKDSLVVEAASDLQQNTANLSNKIWQKITIVQAVSASASVPVSAAGTSLVSKA